MARVVIGLVGYYQFVRGYPIGPVLIEKINAHDWHGEQYDIKEMNWGPIAIVQDFQASNIKYDRVVFVTAVDRGLSAGTVTCRRWLGGELDLLAVQDRVYEAVTGIISLDNLLVIGEHFGIWPEEVICVEAQLNDTAFGDLILDEMSIDQQRGEIGIIGDKPLSPKMEILVQNLTERVVQAVTFGADGMDLVPLQVDQLNSLSNICHNQFMDDCKLQSKPH